MKKSTRSSKLVYLCELAMLLAVMLVMKLLGLDNVQLTPFLKTSFLTVPIAVGAMLMDPLAATILGGMFGMMSLLDAIRGVSVMTATFFSISPVHTVILCLGTRMLMGFLTGIIFKAVKKIDKTRIVCYYLGGLLAPMLNTIFFMGYIVLAFYQTDYIQNLVVSKGAQNAFMFVVLLVGVQGTIEWATGLLVSGTVGKSVSVALKQSSFRRYLP